MRKIAFAIAAAAIMLLAGAFAFTAQATMGPGTLGGLDKNYSPIETVACRFAGPTCPRGYTRVCRLFSCWCARCRY